MAELTKRGSILCQRCGRKRQERVCLSCGWDSCLIRISIEGKYHRIYDYRGRALSYKDALEHLITINRQLEDGDFDIRNWAKVEIEKKKFGHLFKVWLGQREIDAHNQQFSFETLRIYTSYYRNHYPCFYDMVVSEIKKKHIKTFADGLSCAPKFAKNLVDCLHTFMEWAVEWEGDFKLPVFPKMKLIKGQRQRSISYEAQIEAIGRIPEQHRTPFIFMRECGLRISEGCAVKIKDLDIPGHQVLIQRTYSGKNLVETTKGRSREWVPMSSIAQEIAEKLTKGRFGEDFLFINPETGRGYRAASLRRYWNVYSGAGVRVHEGIRHSTISDWARSANAFQVKELARHSDIKTSQIYVHNALTDLRDVVNRGKVIEIREVTGE